jgi:uncharacterized protein YneF (UPF0154 family)
VLAVASLGITFPLFMFFAINRREFNSVVINIMPNITDQMIREMVAAAFLLVLAK